MKTKLIWTRFIKDGIEHCQAEVVDTPIDEHFNLKVGYVIESSPQKTVLYFYIGAETYEISEFVFVEEALAAAESHHKTFMSDLLGAHVYAFLSRVEGKIIAKSITKMH